MTVREVAAANERAISAICSFIIDVRGDVEVGGPHPTPRQTFWRFTCIWQKGDIKMQTRQKTPVGPKFPLEKWSFTERYNGKNGYREWGYPSAGDSDAPLRWPRRLTDAGWAG